MRKNIRAPIVVDSLRGKSFGVVVEKLELFCPEGIADIVEKRLAQRFKVSLQAAMQDGGF